MSNHGSQSTCIILYQKRTKRSTSGLVLSVLHWNAGSCLLGVSNTGTSCATGLVRGISSSVTLNFCGNSCDPNHSMWHWCTFGLFCLSTDYKGSLVLETVIWLAPARISEKSNCKGLLNDTTFPCLHPFQPSSLAPPNTKTCLQP